MREEGAGFTIDIDPWVTLACVKEELGVRGGAIVSW